MSKRISILGAGESGIGAAMLAKSKGAEVFVSDSGSIAEKYVQELLNLSINFEQGGHHENYILNSDLIIKSPGIPESAPIMKKIRATGISVLSEIEYAAQFSHAQFIAITGSNGKTTTSLLTYYLLQKLGLNVGLAGNIGDSLAKQVVKDQYDFYVVELSSFQLDDMQDFKADIAIMLNITPDHLDRYEYNFQNYINSKFKIVQNMTKQNYFIYNSDDKVISDNLCSRQIDPALIALSLSSQKYFGALATLDQLSFSLNQKFTIPTEHIPLKGKHNMINAMAAISVASLLGFEKNQIEQAIVGFQNAPHRLEPIGVLDGVEYINDSKATNVDSVWYALDSFPKPIVWIAGGVDKGNDYSLLTDLVKDRVKALVCMGTDNTALHKAFDSVVDTIVDASSIQEAVEKASYLAESGDVVLLSPACASFDLFKNYIDRGDQFKKLVHELISTNSINNQAL
jgi:UDP-N-acetylmuramoylalanine--D-glutamate ligase